MTYLVTDVQYLGECTCHREPAYLVELGCGHLTVINHRLGVFTNRLPCRTCGVIQEPCETGSFSSVRGRAALSPCEPAPTTQLTNAVSAPPCGEVPGNRNVGGDTRTYPLPLLCAHCGGPIGLPMSLLSPVYLGPRCWCGQPACAECCELADLGRTS